MNEVAPNSTAWSIQPSWLKLQFLLNWFYKLILKETHILASWGLSKGSISQLQECLQLPWTGILQTLCLRTLFAREDWLPKWKGKLHSTVDARKTQVSSKLLEHFPGKTQQIKPSPIFPAEQTPGLCRVPRSFQHLQIVLCCSIFLSVLWQLKS